MQAFSRIFYGWWIVFTCATLIVVCGGPFFYGFSVLVEPLLQEFGWSTLAMAAAFSFRSEVSAFAAPVAGFLVDRFGPRTVMAAGVLIVAGGLLWLSSVSELWTFYASVLPGLGRDELLQKPVQCHRHLPLVPAASQPGADLCDCRRRCEWLNGATAGMDGIGAGVASGAGVVGRGHGHGLSAHDGVGEEQPGGEGASA